MTYLLDTNTISLWLRRQSGVTDRLEDAVLRDSRFCLSPVVHYETLRGLLALDAVRQIVAYRELVTEWDYLPFQQSDWERAAELWAERRALGRPIHDADLLIAVSAIGVEATLVTNNTRDFLDLGVELEDWAQP